jgi:hypothetical protein
LRQIGAVRRHDPDMLDAMQATIAGSLMSSG